MDQPETPTVLLVEDEAIIAMTEQRMLEKHGFAVITVGSGEAAVSTVHAHPEIEVILMDIDLGDAMDGTEAAVQILEIREVPIVFLTSHSEREMVAKVKGITRYGYVMKMSGEFVLLEAISMAQELFAAHQQMAAEIEARRETERRLTERTTFIETVLDNLPIGLAVNYIDEGRATYMNRRFEQIYGWPKEMLTDNSHFFETVYPDPNYRREITARITADIESGDPKRMRWDNVRVTRSDGSEAIVSAVNIPLHEQNLMISTVQDMTQQTQLADLFDRVVATALDGFLLVESDGRIMMANPAYAHMSGYTTDELLTLRVTDIEAAESSEEIAEHFKQIIAAGGARFMTRHRRKDGSSFDVDVSVAVVDAARGRMVSFVRDATEQLQRERLLDAVTQGVPGFVYQFEESPDGTYRFPFVNNAFAEMFGYPLGRIQDNPETVLGAIPEPDRIRVLEAIADSSRTLTPYRCVHRLADSRGHFHWLDVRANPERGAEGGTLWRGVAIDITTEIGGRESFGRLFDLMNVPLAEARMNGMLVRCNDAFCRLLGYPREALMGMHIDEYSHPEDRAREFRDVDTVAIAGEETVFEYDKRFIHRDGHVIPTRLYGAALRDADGTIESALAAVVPT